VYLRKVTPERITVSDGTQLQVRMIEPTDKQRIADGFARLSSTSRYARFHGRKKLLSPDELRFLTEVDGVAHFALVAVKIGDGSREEEFVGVVRVIEEEPGVAEFAIVVADEMQRKGIGRLLYQRAAVIAAERGFSRFRGALLQENHAIRHFLEHVSPGVMFRRDGSSLNVEIAIPGHELPCAPANPLHRASQCHSSYRSGAV